MLWRCYNKLMLRSYKSSLLVLPAILLAGLYINTNAFADSNDVDFSITVNPSLTLALSSNTVNFSITPTAQGAYNSANFTVTSATNNITGYTLVMGTNNVDLTSSTINPVTSEFPTIPTLTETQDGISASAFEASTDSNILNHYGVAIGANNFNAMETEKTVKETLVNNASGVDTTTISLASKLDLNTVPGTYSTTFNFQMTANFVPITLEDAYAGAGKTKATIENEEYYAMQDMTTAICNNANVINEPIEAYDTRDNTIYHIGKLADNRCWLLDNLALDLTSTDVKNAMYDSTDSTHNTMTNATNEQLGYLFNGGRNSEDAATYNLPTAGVANWTSSYSYSAPLVNMASKDMTRADLINPEDPLTEANDWKFGGYYNYCVASAGSYCYGDDTSEGDAVDKLDTDIDAEYDICPSGWRMPTGGASGEYQALANAITGGTSDWINTEPEYSNIRKALSLPISGGFYDGSAGDQGSYGYFWSSTYDSSDYMYNLFVNASEVLPQGYDDRFYGNSVRCIAQ